MSWEIFVGRFREEYACLADMPDDEECLPLGSCAEVRAVIDRHFPGVDWRDPSWGTADLDIGSVGFNVSSREPCTGVMLHIRASDDIVPMIVAMCRSRRWQALDGNAGTFLEKSEDPAAGLRAWAGYRDQVVGDD